MDLAQQASYVSSYELTMAIESLVYQACAEGVVELSDFLLRQGSSCPSCGARPTELSIREQEL